MKYKIKEVIFILVSLTYATYADASDIISADGDYQASFSGPFSLRQTVGSSTENITCTITLNGSAEKVPGTQDVQVSITSGSSTGGIFSGCNLINFDFSPAWVATIDEADLPNSDEIINTTLHNVMIGTTNLGSCGGSTLPINYTNGPGATISFPNSAPSEIKVLTSFGSKCALTGTLSLYLGDDIDFFQ